MTLHPAFSDGQSVRKPDRTDRYLDRLDAELESLPSNAARIAFLSRQEVQWIARYERFVAEAINGTATGWPGDDEPHASDYLCTITAIAARKSELEGAR